MTTTSPCSDGLFGELFAPPRYRHAGELGLDRYGLRATLAELGVEYVRAKDQHT